MQDTRILERAFALARTGDHKCLTTIRPVLRKEGFTNTCIEEHLGGYGIRLELRVLCRAARQAVPDNAIVDA